MKPQRVLLLMDVQVCRLAEPPVGVPAASIVGPNIARVLATARAATSNPPLIVHVRNAGVYGEPDEPHSAGWQLVHAPLAHEPVIDKTKNNAFAGTALAQFIRTDAEIVVVGIQSDFCVRATCSAALGRGNQVLLIRGAHATYDRIEVWHEPITAAAVVEQEIEEELEEAGVVLLEMDHLPEIFTDRDG